MRERGASAHSHTPLPHRRLIPPRGMTYRFYIDSIIRTIRVQLRFLITKREVCKFAVDAHSSTPDASDVRVKPDVHRSLLRDCSRGPARSNSVAATPFLVSVSDQNPHLHRCHPAHFTFVDPPPNADADAAKPAPVAATAAAVGPALDAVECKCGF
jgi:hypothetical protein